MDFAFVLDPLPALKAYKDSSVAMMRALVQRGHRVFALGPPDLCWDAAGTRARVVPLVSKAAGGKQIRTFKYSKVLPGLLGIGIVASDEKIRSNPGEVRAFTRALLRGLRYSIDNPGEAGYILRKYQPLVDPVVAAQELRIMKFFVQNRLTRQKQNGIGYIDVQKFNATASVIRNGFRLSGRLDAAETWSPVAVNVRRAAR